ncbi:ABC transporter [Epidermidibacterium keratini]|uniref:ABC transporter n=1 Tax=Epidermidibacterium keratini TaxID=1891644 RepID=A0A7L4YN99_9ACTN|nr:GTPase [Epidermidibacterium keratini]QHC00616.1 ABC transporter [Epidermidibacterium keratini]
MSIFGRREKEVTSAEIARRVQDLRDALDTGRDRLDPTVTAQARDLVTKVNERKEIGSGYTVVALAGATGSGKSSLFNRIAGADVSQVGVRRPTTSTATAAIWGPDSAARLLDWLGVGARHQVGEGALDGLVLLDLPDFDSHEAGNRAEADRVLALADVFIWVTDPQKYADAVLHNDYIRALSTKDTKTVVLLNQADRLTVAEVEQCIADLTRILDNEGVKDATILPTSAVTGAGLDELMSSLAEVVAAQNAAHRRLHSDLRSMAERLRTGVADKESAIDDVQPRRLVDALAQAAGVPVVLGAVQRDYTAQATRHAGWPFTKWLRRLRPDPLRRLGLGRGEREDGPVSIELGRSSLPSATPAQRSAVDLASRDVADRAAAGLPLRWAQAVERAASPQPQDSRSDELSDALDQAVLSTPLSGRTPIWWRVVGVLQWLFALTAVAGLGWLLVLVVLGWLQLNVDTPAWGPIPIPTLLLAGGLVLGLVTTALMKIAARIGARRRRERVRDRLYRAIGDVADKQIIEPVAAVLAAHRRTRELLDAALR